jgi:hypothetical protein
MRLLIVDSTVAASPPSSFDCAVETAIQLDDSSSGCTNAELDDDEEEPTTEASVSLHYHRYCCV